MAGALPILGGRNARHSLSESNLHSLRKPILQAVPELPETQHTAAEVLPRSRTSSRALAMSKLSIKSSETSSSNGKRPATHSLDRPRKLGTAECMAKMASGHWIDVVVGPEKKTYKLPADILAYYSPIFGMATLAGPTIRLPKDSTADFEALIDFMIKGTLQDALAVDRWGDLAIERCVSFVVYAKKYDLGPVDDIVYDLLKAALMSDGDECLRGHHIERIFNSTSIESKLRVLITQGALSFGGISTGPIAVYRKQENQVQGFAAELLRQVRLASLSTSWLDPFSGSKKRSDKDWHGGRSTSVLSEEEIWIISDKD
ncbi:uncharacterized protein RAG0_16340 [Rhynchosporium agropyri]|uniref:BTB domain-containing protein n=1 Tax=Rhynchosporium agropyri TaxID=914238 RepID=A0A1E1LQ15_9HELO|nr:uncharacterized protein RAG0_16340 [Rhynchosporium agropyri]